MNGNSKTLLALSAAVGISFQGSSVGEISIDVVTNDSRAVSGSSVFVAMPGAMSDGHEYISDAYDRGCRVFVLSRCECELPDNVAYALVGDTRDVYHRLVNALWDSPSQDIHVVGITGTNGKSTTAFLVRHILAPENKTGIITTLYGDVAGERYPLENTTPDFSVVTQLMARMKDADCSHCAMEVSSHALHQGRISGCHFSTVLFTNLTQDHLDYHVTMDEYYAVKRTLFFEHNNGARVIINTDDPYGKRLCDEYARDCVTYGTSGSEVVSASDIDLCLEGTRYRLTVAGESVQVVSPLLGRHNVYNVLAAVAVAVGAGISLGDIAERLLRFNGVCGRMESVENALGLPVFVDYAHTPDAIENVLRSTDEVTKKPLVVVFGCGGDRDRAKRPLMREAAERYADHLIVTQDNPRTESSDRIIDDIMQGISSDVRARCVVIENRAEAINHACVLALKHEGVVLILGKGHEDYQIIGTEKHHFSDQETVRQCAASLHAERKSSCLP